MGGEHLVAERPHLVLALAVDNLHVLAHGLLGGSEAESLVGHSENSGALLGEDGDVGGESGLELEVGVGGRDDHLVGYHIVGGGRLESHLLDFALEGVVGVGVDGEGDAVALLDAAYVGLIDIGYHLHIGKVLGDGEELGGVEAGCHGLAFLHALGNHGAVDGRGDGGVTQIGLRSLYALSRRGYLLLGLTVGEHRVLVLIGAHQSLLEERLVALHVGGLVLEGALGTGEVGFGYVEFAHEIGLVELGNHLSLLDLGIVVYVELADDAAHLRTHGDRGYSLDGARGGHAVLQRLQRHLVLLEVDFLLLLAAGECPGSNADDCHHDDGKPDFADSQFLHNRVCLFVVVRCDVNKRWQDGSKGVRLCKT